MHVDVGSGAGVVDDEIEARLVVRVIVVFGLGDVERAVVLAGSVVVVRIVWVIREVDGCIVIPPLVAVTVDDDVKDCTGLLVETVNEILLVLIDTSIEVLVLVIDTIVVEVDELIIEGEAVGNVMDDCNE